MTSETDSQYLRGLRQIARCGHPDTPRSAHADPWSFGTTSRETASYGHDRAVRIGLTGLACGILTACAGTAPQESGGDCASHYASVASATTWEGLKEAMLRDKKWGRVASVRTQAWGDDVGAGDQDAVNVVDLLNRTRRRLVQVDVWRTDAGEWRSGVWMQCID